MPRYLDKRTITIILGIIVAALIIFSTSSYAISYPDLSGFEPQPVEIKITNILHQLKTKLPLL
ncbi:hypothetical protein E1176_17115 [Fulvivirga sp. RKSG066]|uniref:hypothetical protein n=1 Tax=Fulvivirga aurantia TaxID=2529383 RepID=UPI0012BB6A56|nr:hypothetical protein [Fulvivirga aurantia]MTI22755.1 hypothetical protein [Fulvivirga aurantia]